MSLRGPRGPNELKRQQTSKGEDASHGRLFIAVRCDKNEYVRQKYLPAALDDLVVVRVGPCVRATGS